MICAITKFQWRTNGANRLRRCWIVAYRKKGNGKDVAIAHFLMAQQWRNGGAGWKTEADR